MLKDPSVYQKKIAKLLEKKTVVDEDYVARKLHVTDSRAEAIMIRLPDDGEVETFMGSYLAEVAKKNGFWIKTPKSIYCTLRGQKEEAVKQKIVEILEGNIKIENAKIDQEIARLKGKKPYPYVDSIMELLPEAQAGSDRVYNFVLNEMDTRMRQKIRLVEGLIEKVESTRSAVENFKGNKLNE